MTIDYFTKFLETTDNRLVSKWMHYFEAYAAELGHLQGKDITFLEIGVWKGGSIPMWRGYFGKGGFVAQILGWDSLYESSVITGRHEQLGPYQI